MSSVVSANTGIRECVDQRKKVQSSLMVVSSEIKSTDTRGVITDDASVSERSNMLLIFLCSWDSTAHFS